MGHHALAQCRPAPNSHEAKLLAFYSVPIVFSTDAPTAWLPAGDLRATLEGVVVPQPSAALQRTGECFTSKSEHTNLTPLFGRPRVALALPAGFLVEASYLPPVTVAGAQPNLFSAALSYQRHVGPLGSLVARWHVTAGDVRGAITCPASALQQTDSLSPCYGTKPSRDTFRPNMTGGEIGFTSSPTAHLIAFNAGVGVNALHPRFRTGFTDGNGHVDHTLIVVDLTRVSAFVGATAFASRRCDLSGQVYSSPSDVTTVRLLGGCRLR